MQRGHTLDDTPFPICFSSSKCVRYLCKGILHQSEAELGAGEEGRRIVH